MSGWIVWDGCDLHEFDTQDEAVSFAEGVLDDYRHDAADCGWYECSGNVLVARVTHYVHCEVIPVTDDNVHLVPSGCDGLEERTLVKHEKTA